MSTGRRALHPYETKNYLAATAGAAALCVVGGFADLARGGTVIAPILLVIAYLALIPLAIVRRPGNSTSRGESPLPSYGAAAIVSVAVFILYILTLAPSTAMWDTSEYIAAAYTLGLPHPPGNPLFVLVGRVFALLPIAPNVAERINVLAAICSAASAGMWFLITERVLVGWFPARWQRIAGGVVAALIGATAFTVWNQSVVNEKVYTVSLVGIAIISWLMIRWSDDPDGPKADRILVLVAYLSGLGYANHMAGFLAAPAAALAVLVRRPATFVRWRLLLAIGGALVLGLTPFATQPIRAGYFPPINEGEPTACRTHISASCTFSGGTYNAFMYNFNRGQYGKPEVTDRQAPFSAQIGMWWLYFKWQWLRDAYSEHSTLQTLIACLFLALGFLGSWVHWQRDRRSFWYFGAYMFTVTLLLIYYLNFKYGASQAPDLGDSVPREVRDRDYFFLWSFSPWGVWAGLGLLYIWESLASLVQSRRSWVMTAPVLLVAMIPLFNNWHTASRRGDHTTLAFAHDLLDSVEPYGILITNGDNDTFPLWYAQEVEGIRKDVTVAVLSLLNTDWYLRGIIRRPAYTYDAAKGPAIYRGGNWPKPSVPPVHMTLAEADSLPPYALIRRAMELRKGSLAATIDPRHLTQDGAGDGVLERKDIIVLRMIADGWPERPVYFSGTTGAYTDSLGLSGFVLTQGLARKLFVPPAAPGSDTVLVRGAGWFDLPRSLALWTDVFRGPRAVVAHGQWIDRPSVGIPLTYVFAGNELAVVLEARSDSARAARVLDTAAAVARSVHADDLFQAIHPARGPRNEP